MNQKIMLLLFLLLSLSGNAQNDAQQFAKSVADEYKKAASVSYDVDFRMKFFDYDDTTSVSGRCFLIRDVKDEVNGGRVWLDSKDEEGDFSTYYDLDKIYYIMHPKKEIMVFDPKQEETGPLTGSTQSNIKNTFFMKPEKLLEYATTYPSSAVDTVMAGKTYTLLRIDWPGENEIKSRRFRILINNNTLQIEQIKYYVTVIEGTELQTQYNEWNLKNIKFNSVSTAELDHKLNSLKSYARNDFDYPDETEMKPLASGTPAPGFRGSLYTENKTIDLADYKGKIIILDFWFYGCQPCVLAIPGLNKLQEKYKGDVVVIGINPVNHEEKQLKLIPAYMARNQVAYTLARGEENLDEEYKVFGYPTLYIIDRDGVIHSSHGGYSDDMERAIEKDIIELLKK